MKCIIWLTQKVVTLQLKYTFWMYINLSINSSKVFIDRNIIQSEKYPNFCLMFGHIYFRAIFYLYNNMTYVSPGGGGGVGGRGALKV